MLALLGAAWFAPRLPTALFPEQLSPLLLARDGQLLGARIAWASADNALQVHGGNGFALEYPISRVLCDARILNIFEGAAEIQAQVITRRLLEKRN